MCQLEEEELVSVFDMTAKWNSWLAVHIRYDWSIKDSSQDTSQHWQGSFWLMGKVEFRLSV